MFLLVKFIFMNPVLFYIMINIFIKNNDEIFI
jgi:hypothetical protein